MDGVLDDLLRRRALWRARDVVGDADHGPAAVPSGFPALDACLPGGGWPTGALTEVLHPASGIGELSLLLPALAGLSRGERWLAWIAPPFDIVVPALEARGVDAARVMVVREPADGRALWAAEQALRSGACAAVLCWMGVDGNPAGPRRRDRPTSGVRAPGAPRLTFRHLRRLQLAARAGTALGVVFRDAVAAAQPSPAALRVGVRARGDGLEVAVLKGRGTRPARVRVPPPWP